MCVRLKTVSSSLSLGRRWYVLVVDDVVLPQPLWRARGRDNDPFISLFFIYNKKIVFSFCWYLFGIVICFFYFLLY